MKTFTLNKQSNIYVVLSVLGLFFIISCIALADQKIESPSPFESEETYVSPDGRFQAITIQKSEEVIETYINDENGRMIVEPHKGSFISWSPDSSKVLLFLSAIQNPKGRELYILSTNGSYENSGLPVGTISAAYSSDSSIIVYSLTRGGTDDSEIYVRNSKGEDQLLLNGNSNILTWVRWSPQGNKILFMQSDLLLRPGKQSLWIMDSDGNNREKIAPIDWNYPAAWSPDGTKIAFANAGNIWEYEVQNMSLIRLTNQEIHQPAMHPEYSQDGENITYVAESSFSEKRLSIGSSQSSEIKKPVPDSDTTPDSEVSSSTSENEIINPEETTIPAIEAQPTNI